MSDLASGVEHRRREPWIGPFVACRPEHGSDAGARQVERSELTFDRHRNGAVAIRQKGVELVATYELIDPGENCAELHVGSGRRLPEIPGEAHAIPRNRMESACEPDSDLRQLVEINVVRPATARQLQRGFPAGAISISHGGNVTAKAAHPVKPEEDVVPAVSPREPGVATHRDDDFAPRQPQLTRKLNSRGRSADYEDGS